VIFAALINDNNNSSNNKTNLHTAVRS